MGGRKLVQTAISSDGREDDLMSWPSPSHGKTTVFRGAWKMMTRSKVRKMSVLKKAKRRMVLSE